MKRIHWRRDDGVAMTEFALIVPVFLVIVAGLLGFGRVFFYWIGANHLANETARWAVVDRNPDATAFPNPDALQKYARANGGTVEFTDTKSLHRHPRRRHAGGGRADRGEDLEAVHDASRSSRSGRSRSAGTATMRIERFANGTGPTNYNVGSPIGACT